MGIANQFQQALVEGEYTIDPKKVLPAVQKALEKITGAPWKHDPAVLTATLPFSRFHSTKKGVGRTRVEWKGSGKFAMLSIESKKHTISTSGRAQKEFESADFIEKMLRQSHFEPVAT